MALIVVDARAINSTTGRYVVELLEGLQAQKSAHDFVVLVHSRDLHYWIPSEMNFEVVALDVEPYSIAEQVRMRSALGALKPDLVHFTMPQQPIFYRGPSVTTVHDLTLLLAPPGDRSPRRILKRIAGRFVFVVGSRKSRLVICPSRHTAADVKRFACLEDARVRVIYEGAVDTSAASEGPASLRGHKFLLYVGTHSWYKNARRLIMAHQSLLGDYPELRLAFVGRLSGKSGETVSESRQWVEMQGFKNIVFTDFLSDEDLAWCYSNSSAYVFPSFHEGFGLPGLEAMAYGAPVVSSEASCLPEIYGDAPEYFDPSSTEDVVRALRRVLDDPVRVSEMRRAGAEQAARYSWERMAGETMEVYEQAMLS